MKYFVLTLGTTLILLLGIIFQVNAESITGLYNTGVDDAGNTLPVNIADPHYILSGPTGNIAYTVPYPTVWVTPPGGSSWIGPQVHSDELTCDPPAVYSYALNFCLTNLNPDTAVIMGYWGSDNTSSIWLNGIDTGFNQEFQFLELKEFILQVGQNISFLSGLNTLEFRVTNWDNGNHGNPSGLLVSGLYGTASPIPEPSTMLLFGLGLLVFSRISRRIGDAEILVSPLLRNAR